MIGIQLDGDGYSLVGKRSPGRWRPFWQSGSGSFHCEVGVSESDLPAVSKCLLSLIGPENKAALCLGPGLVKRFEFTVPAEFSAINVYTWVEQNLESWMGEAPADCYFDYVPATKDNRTDFVLYSAERSSVDQCLMPLRNAHLSITRLEVAEQTLPRLFSDLVWRDIMLADIGARDTHIYTISAGCCQWLGAIRSPLPNRPEHEAVEIFQAGLQRLIVSHNRSPATLVLAGVVAVATALSHWLQPMLPGTDIRLVQEVSGIPGEALLATSAVLG